MKKFIFVLCLVLLLSSSHTSASLQTFQIGEIEENMEWTLADGSYFKTLKTFEIPPDYIDNDHIWSTQLRTEVKESTWLKNFTITYNDLTLVIGFTEIDIQDVLITKKGGFPVHEIGSLNLQAQLINGSTSKTIDKGYSYVLNNQHHFVSSGDNPFEAAVSGEPVKNSMMMYNDSEQFTLRYNVVYSPTQWYDLQYDSKSLKAVNITKYVFLDLLSMYDYQDDSFTFEFRPDFGEIIYETDTTSREILEDDSITQLSVYNETKIYTSSIGIPLYMENTDGNTGWTDLGSYSDLITPFEYNETLTETITTTVSDVPEVRDNTTDASLPVPLLVTGFAILIIPIVRRIKQ